jgi:hypothetical protein
MCVARGLYELWGRNTYAHKNEARLRAPEGEHQITSSKTLISIYTFQNK